MNKVLFGVVFSLGLLLLTGAMLAPFIFILWLQTPASNAFHEWAGMPKVTVKTVKPKTIPCKILDDDAGTKECKVKMDDGRTVTCIVDSNGRSCDWEHATARKGK